MDILAKSEYNRPDPGIKNPNNQIRYNFHFEKFRIPILTC